MTKSSLIPKLQVLIVAYGRKGIESVARLSHPRVEGVEYIVSWQYADDEPVIPSVLQEREDFTVIPTPTRGVARNRNLTLDAATAPVVLESDDDVFYTEEQLLSVIRAFEEHPDADYIHFHYHSDENPIRMWDFQFDMKKPPRWWYMGGAIEMAFRLEPIRRNNIRFNELFGIGSEFPAGEEDLFINDVVKAGLKAIYLPITIVTHPGTSTAMRMETTDSFIRTKGAVFMYLHPHTWPLRMLAHARRFSKSPREIIRYIRAWLRGARDLKKITADA
ncbi:MAG: glycosyltransferase [Muribaculaceae bacterium]|nr:glycosyltransferase [Muribaculaceae bacterium]